MRFVSRFCETKDENKRLFIFIFESGSVKKLTIFKYSLENQRQSSKQVS